MSCSNIIIRDIRLRSERVEQTHSISLRIKAMKTSVILVATMYIIMHIWLVVSDHERQKGELTLKSLELPELDKKPLKRLQRLDI